ncbi:MAG: 50S ribosomal protein L2 [Bacteroidota bacterium]|jgi:large subunit ribosomal protein L2|uniref:50S ribosomal protein L2 n=1 Tax=Candidatus Pollutiaquabacter sp. TaxID=3416354 RepID=UPI001A3F8965|nr:50S ribosomal protein L2 [Bacteroidota bacterium]MBL7948571.1 50S ribosomal protein L2 [Bacteroidia bacterium]MBP6009496.1 50S ribosomal protein L2 [Bacteroidia bacterium]MBP7268749.1 50S ribosomal protein L2 [Bacteroidia bacterium]MBP7437277.1 50S ribosomal protein L2 [Bacteroidia bacterium]
MAVKKLRPMTPTQRHTTVDSFEDITASRPEQSLVVRIKRSGGRNSDGKMTMRYIGGGHRKMYRLIDFKRDNHGIEGTVKTIEYDPNRTARIALVNYKNGDKRYIVAPVGLKVGQKVLSGTNATPEIGNALFLKDIPLGTLIHNIELRPGQGAVMARSAGSFAQLAARDGNYAIIKMPSGETRKVLASCLATIGTVSNPDHNKESLGKAGRNRWAGRRPRVRGVAMNPVDHPMGGGEGRASGGHPRSRKGLYAKGRKTRRKNHPTNKYIIERRKK